MSQGSDGYLRPARVELADGYNFIGTVRREYLDSRGWRTLIVEDTQGNRRTARPAYPLVTVYNLDCDRDNTRSVRGGDHHV
jgi:hypothetical protein